MLTLETLEALLQPQGQAALAAAEELALSPATLIKDLDLLRKRFAPDLAFAAVDLVRLRRQATTKFSRADQMYFTRDALEQATSEVVARHTAARYSTSAEVWDLCCSIGGDMVQLAAAGPQVIGIDIDPVRLRMAELNSAVYGVGERVRCIESDVLDWEPPSGASIFFDPARRVDGRRIFDPGQYQPSLYTIDRWLGRVDGIGVKVAPGIDYDHLPWDACEVEIVSLHGDVKEALLWFGRLQNGERSATLLPSGLTLRSTASGHAVAVEHPQNYVYEPDGAVIRAHLVEQLAVEMEATKIDADIAFLSTSTLVETPFARAFRVDDVLPWNLKRLRQYLRERGIGQVVVKKRGSPIDPQVLEHQLRLQGDRSAVIILTHVLGKPSVLICQSSTNDQRPTTNDGGFGIQGSGVGR